jgi:Protein of unknown function (DUF3309)
LVALHVRCEQHQSAKRIGQPIGDCRKIIYPTGDRMSTLLIIILVIVLLGGGGGYYGYSRYGNNGLGGAIGLVVVILLILWLVGAFHGQAVTP